MTVAKQQGFKQSAALVSVVLVCCMIIFAADALDGASSQATVTVTQKPTNVPGGNPKALPGHSWAAVPWVGASQVTTGLRQALGSGCSLKWSYW